MMAETVVPGLERRLQGGARRRGHVRPLHPRPLCDRCLALSGHAARRRGAAHDRRSQSGDSDCAGGGRKRDAARRRHLAGRADGQYHARSSIARNTSTGFSSSMSPSRRCVVEPGIVLDDLNRQAQAARPVVSGRYLDRLARHHRRHGRPTIPAARARCAMAIRARTCSRSTRCWPTARGAFRPGQCRTSPTSPTTSPLKPLARDLLALGAREADAVDGALSAGAAPGRRLQSRRAHAGAQRSQSRAYPGRLRGHARLLQPDRAQARAAARPAAPVGACHFGSFRAAMEAAQHIVKLGPIAVELIDRTMLGLAREIAMFQPTIDTRRARRSRSDPVRRVRRG